MPSEIECSLLVVIIDTDPVWWGQCFLEENSQFNIFRYLDSMLVFANSHLMMKPANKLAIIAAHSNQSYFLYPKGKEEEPKVVTNEVTEENGTTTAANVPPRPLNDGRYELFAQVDDQITEQLKNLMVDQEVGQLYSDSVVAGSIGMALCFINRMEKELHLGDKLSSRILIMKGSQDNPAQYMNFMNTVFSAQKQNVIIDSCILGDDSSLLQQACDITGGTYLKLPTVSGILQYLLCVFLPDPHVRHKLSLPARVQVDYRAACFCHRNLIDIGYVCSVCLSIFCSFSPICSTCQTTFKFLGPPKILKKKIRKNNT
ncbi:general transcription factor IIH subunit 3-like isoform X1 [Octopus vulgaris]|uniref:General transcription factor IIH subunit 3-like isoform X1 n=2 Tax=Octopus TaxID=6643 RepID=A0AA36BW93_OCTVU|nr:general transcription factor IIH subunit 3 [Octopus sinensis]XP_036369204.1 general transcription factor IIH subunit 3 [Octopus sinensis]CAI9740907.1 general transcription factor IIH subunit 3-like isoform X1 [Octopus vulgaris]